MSFETFTSIWSHVNEKKKKIIKFNKRPKGLGTLLGHLPDRNKLGLCRPNSNVPTTYVAEVTHVCVTGVHESSISLHFTLRPAIFELQANFETSALNELKMTLNTEGKRYTIYVLLVSPSLKFQSFMLYGQPFSSCKIFWDSVPNDPKMTLNTRRSNVPHIYVLLVSTSPKFHCFTLQPVVFELHDILRIVHCMTPKWHWILQGQMNTCIPYMC